MNGADVGIDYNQYIGTDKLTSQSIEDYFRNAQYGTYVKVRTCTYFVTFLVSVSM